MGSLTCGWESAHRHAACGRLGRYEGASRDLEPGRSWEEVWRLGYGHDHRGATLYDEDEGVIWLVAYGREPLGRDLVDRVSQGDEVEPHVGREHLVEV